MTKFTLTLIATLGMYCTLQAQSLRGTISDAQGNPLPGASVVADGTNGQFADADGAYVLSLSPGTHTVQFSYIGYISQTKEVTMGNEDQTLNVSLDDDAVLIEDAVVVGYGVQRKESHGQHCQSRFEANHWGANTVI